MDMPTIGFADRLRFPSRASSTSGEMLAFAHIPTGTAANRQGYTLRHGSGCRTFGVHFTL
jgi:hypothetical protein